MSSTTYTIGVDIGSLSTKVALVLDGTLVDTQVTRSTHEFARVGLEMFEAMLQEHNLNREDIAEVMGTGYGRHTVDFATKKITEITAHARGVQYFLPDVRTIIDIGGQDSKVISISPKTGKVIDFQMNDKCAAGTGRFCEVMANALQVPLEELGPLSLQSNKPEQISSTCTVFAESEVISLFAKGAKKQDIAAGIHAAIAKRVGGMVKRLGVNPPVAFCGGVAKNVGVHKALERELGVEILIPEQPQMTGAIGAALLGLEQIEE
ncbi:MAG TPA: acyl-CoA dehydratase activase [Candidatus Lokiarchaeia archaeon]|nr:acyl-CoA dehydratase activase [Candidatus Lokiarchaeia archaeon]